MKPDQDYFKTAPLKDVIGIAWEARMKDRPRVLETVYPVKTMAVSVTGNACSLNCSHCGGRYLGHMVNLKDLPCALRSKLPDSILLSGGCGPDGAVPLVSSLDRVSSILKSYGQEVKVNAHPGVVNDEDARAISEFASVISFDFVLDDEAIREAFHGRWTGTDYVRAFRSLRKGKAKVVPHVLLGLMKGKISKEYDAVEFLLGENVREIIFIVFIPTPGTIWENIPPPDIGDVVRVLAWTRAKAPGLSISLGCMRPKGRYRQELDILAVRAGIDRIVLPHPEVVDAARSLGLEIEKKTECCAFD
ncbi:MAG TPA: radical SAM protein [Firmicutes bacterium]|nr:radical SAM protein [Candidatus Fermentithermobacillaceae bacterium]